MRMDIRNLIAVDLGASSGRLISGQFDGKRVLLKEQFRFSNQPVNVNHHLYWDYLKIFQEIKYGLTIAQRDLKQIDSFSVDTWGVDYGLLSHHDELLFAPHSYRDTRTTEVKEKFYQRVSPVKLFLTTGNQPDLINTNIQLFADIRRYPFLLTEGTTFLMMPNLIGYFFTGVKQSEFTIASTSGLLDAQSRDWNTELLKSLGIPKQWFGDLTVGGDVLGPLQPNIIAELQLDSTIQMINGVGHDTAAALLALPIEEKDRQRAAFISCGTWSIIGRQTTDPVVTMDAADAGLTNEGCFDGTNRLLKNVTGLWIIQELQREWSYKGMMIDFDKMTAEAKAAASINSYIDPNHPLFAEPGRMEEKIKLFLEQTGQQLPKNRGQLVRVVLESLAMVYRKTIHDLQKVTGEPVKVVHIFGGGIQNQLLVQLTADLTQLPVVAGPVETSVLGNIVSQLLVLKQTTPDHVVNIMNHSYAVKTYRPSRVESFENRLKKFEMLLKQEQDLDLLLEPKIEMG